MAIYDVEGNLLNSNSTSLDFDKIVKGIAHRGYSTTAPENTLPAYKLAKKNGFNYVECDVSLTSDGVPMLLHDATIDRTSNGSGTLSQMTYAAVRQYDFGSWKSSAYTGTLIPTFEEFIALCRNIGLHPYIELKSTGGYTQSQIESLVDIVHAHGMADKVTWISFTGGYLTNVKNYDANARLGYVTDTITSATISTAQGLKTTTNDVFIDGRISYLTDTTINLCITAGIPLEVWFTDDASVINGLNPYVTGVTSNCLIAGQVLYDANIT